jgi:hypothetical protein
LGIFTVLLVATPLIASVMATEDVPNSTDTQLRHWFVVRLQQIKSRLNSFGRFFRGSEKTVITGTVTARSENIIIVTEVDGDRYNIVLPRRWNIDQQIVELEDIDPYLSDEVTVKTLSRRVTNENEVTVTMLIAYEIITDGSTLFAVLPYNING